MPSSRSASSPAARTRCPADGRSRRGPRAPAPRPPVSGPRRDRSARVRAPARNARACASARNRVPRTPAPPAADRLRPRRAHPGAARNRPRTVRSQAPPATSANAGGSSIDSTIAAKASFAGRSMMTSVSHHSIVTSRSTIPFSAAVSTSGRRISSPPARSPRNSEIQPRTPVAAMTLATDPWARAARSSSSVKSSARWYSSIVTRPAKTCVGAYAPAPRSETRTPFPSACSHSARTSGRSSPSNADTIANAPDRARAGHDSPRASVLRRCSVLSEARNKRRIDRAGQAARQLELECQFGFQALDRGEALLRDICRGIPATLEGAALRQRQGGERAPAGIDGKVTRLLQDLPSLQDCDA